MLLKFRSSQKLRELTNLKSKSTNCNSQLNLEFPCWRNLSTKESRDPYVLIKCLDSQVMVDKNNKGWHLNS